MTLSELATEHGRQAVHKALVARGCYVRWPDIAWALLAKAAWHWEARKAIAEAIAAADTAADTWADEEGFVCDECGSDEWHTEGDVTKENLEGCFGVCDWCGLLWPRSEDDHYLRSR